MRLDYCKYFFTFEKIVGIYNPMPFNLQATGLKNDEIFTQNIIGILLHGYHIPPLVIRLRFA